MAEPDTSNNQINRKDVILLLAGPVVSGVFAGIFAGLKIIGFALGFCLFLAFSVGGIGMWFLFRGSGNTRVLGGVCLAVALFGYFLVFTNAQYLIP